MIKSCFLHIAAVNEAIDENITEERNEVIKNGSVNEGHKVVMEHHKSYREMTEAPDLGCDLCLAVVSGMDEDLAMRVREQGVGGSLGASIYFISICCNIPNSDAKAKFRNTGTQTP